MTQTTSTPNSMPNDALATVQRMFAAFGAGDFPALLATVHPESHWTYYGANPTLSQAEFRGRDAVQQFFEGIVGRFAITEFNTDTFVTDGDTVVIFGSEAGTVKETGESFRNVWSQKYVVRDGLIVEMAEYNVQVEPRG